MEGVLRSSYQKMYESLFIVNAYWLLGKKKKVLVIHRFQLGFNAFNKGVTEGLKLYVFFLKKAKVWSIITNKGS